jgi:peptidoglycan hydrolase-like protein with peptidoglycan-binding domain
VREALARSDRDFLSEDAANEPSEFLATMQFILRRPIEVAGVLTMVGLTVCIIVNALALQTGPHPAPIFPRGQAALETVPARPPQELSAAALERLALVRTVQTELAARGLYDGAADGLAGPKTEAAIRFFQDGAGLEVDGLASTELLAELQKAPAARKRDAIATLITASTPSPPTRRLVGIERALAILGYGPLKVDGLMDANTSAAIERFESDRGLPVTGAVSARLARELAEMSGVSVE